MVLHGYQVVALEWAMVVLTAIFVSLRFYIRVLTRGYWPVTENFVLTAWLSFVAQAIMDTLLLYDGFLEDTWVTISERGYKILYTENALYMFCMYAIKSAMLCFYYELIPPIMWKTRIAMWVTVVTVALSCVLTFGGNLFGCLPVWRNWSTDPKINCLAITSPAGRFTKFPLHILTDIMVYILPFPILRELHNVPRRQKIGVGITFGLGFLCIVMAVMVFSSEYILNAPAFIWLWPVFEQTWSITVVCCPAFKLLLMKTERRGNFLSPNELRSRFGKETGASTTLKVVDEMAGTTDKERGPGARINFGASCGSEKPEISADSSHLGAEDLGRETETRRWDNRDHDSRSASQDGWSGCEKGSRDEDLKDRTGVC